MSRLTINISEQQHQTLEAMAALEGKTLRQYALERLLPSFDEETQAWAELKTFLQTRIDAGVSGDVTSDTFDEIVAEEMAKRPHGE
ncbi:antitoxin [Asticcacaulis sp. BYS171W]|uniref:Antitoxin n=1 Tax=Asticcacaulis aquaticus TaxID=2984212 RepID=A0ABT5HYM4_9CAUL|nr:antitoxin [Asticcacaulis aquaticus]MDC7685153.1 antitoxin [Asticcacaulis aquaticus]